MDDTSKTTYSNWLETMYHGLGFALKMCELFLIRFLFAQL